MDQLKQIGKEMVTQDCRATQNVLFVVQEDVEKVTSEELVEDHRRKDDMREGMCDHCKHLDDEGMAPDYCLGCDSDCFYAIKVEEEFNLNAGVFFTAKACEEHIKLNGYHYTNPRCYGIGAWRNPEMIAVMKHLIVDVAGEKLPSKYDN